MADISARVDDNVDARIHSARDHASDLRDRISDFAGLGDEDGLIDRTRDQLAVLRDRLDHLRGSAIDTAQNTAGNTRDRLVGVRDRLAQRVEGLRDRLDNTADNVNAPSLIARVNAIRDRLGDDLDDGRLEQLRDDVRELRSAVNALPGDVREGDAFVEVRARVAAIADDVNEYVSDRYVERVAGASPGVQLR